MSSSYQKFAGVCGSLAGIAGLVYLIAFLVLKNPAALVPALALLVVGILSSATLVALYLRVREVDAGFALWGLAFGLGGAGGAAIHSAFDLTNALHPPDVPFGYANPVDPRGVLTFAAAGIAAIVLGLLIVRGGVFSRALGYLGVASGLLLIVLYLSYLIILNATNPLVLIILLVSGVLQPVWYLWLGWQLWRGEVTMPATIAAARSR
jgi:hypothetical protein